MTAAERILIAYRNGVLCEIEEPRFNAMAVQCARDYYEACRFLMECITQFDERYGLDLYDDVILWLTAQGLSEPLDGNKARLRWDKLPKEAKGE